MILILFSKNLNINASYNVLFASLQSIDRGDLRVIDINSYSFKELCFFIGESSLLVFDNSIYQSYLLSSLYKKNKNALVSHYVVNSSSFYLEVWGCLLSADKRKLFIASGWDLHWRFDFLGQLKNNISAIAWMFESYPLSFAAVPDKYKDSWMCDDNQKLNEGFTRVDPLKTYNEIVKSFPVRIELVHSLAAHEFDWVRKRKFWDCSIAGAGYKTRQVSKSSVLTNQLSLAPYDFSNKCIQIAHKYGKYFMPRHMSISARICAMKYNQKFITSRSRIGITCGSGIMYEVRKLFEIPALRVPMICYVDKQFSRLGFIDGLNCIYSTPEDAGRHAKYLLQNESFMNELADNAFQDVLRLHSSFKRSRDFLACLDKLNQGTLKGAKFVDGLYQIY